MADIYKVLGDEHAELLRLIEQLEAGVGDATTRRHLVDRLVGTASRHEAGEELALWPVVRRRVPGGDDLARRGLGEEGDARYLLDALRVDDSVLASVTGIIRGHIAFEEDQVWPVLRRSTGAIGAAMMAARLRLGGFASPTRPHPGGPVRPFGLATRGAAAAFADRARDRLTGRSLEPPGGGMDASAFIVSEHTRIDGLLAEVEHGDPDPSLAARLVKELSVHDSIEREHLYPLLRRRLEQGNDRYPGWIAEHGRIATVLAEIDRRPDGDRRRRELLQSLVTLVRTHVAEEEEAVLPAMRAHLSEEERAELGARLEAAKAKAPTRPHAHLAGAGVGARLSRLVVAPMDKSRDALARRA